jgi:acyl carrier protein
VSQAEILDRIQQAFADAFIPVEGELNAETAFDEIDGLDSVSRVRLFLSLEDAFAIEISPREGSRLNTIGDILKLVLEKQNSDRSPHAKG